MTVPPRDIAEITLLALACSLPVVLLGALIIRLARSWSMTVTMVALVLIPVLATLTGVVGASGFMITDTFARTAVVLRDRRGGDGALGGDAGALSGPKNGVGAGDS